MTMAAHRECPLKEVIPFDDTHFPRKDVWFREYAIAPFHTKEHILTLLKTSLLDNALRRGDVPIHQNMGHNLLKAVVQGNIVLMEQYKTCHVPMTFTTESGINVLCAALLSKWTDVLSWLLANRVNINVAKKNIHPLWICCSDGQVDQCVSLINAGADVNWADIQERTALMVAAQFGQKDIINILLQHGAELNHLSRDGHSALHYAICSGQVSVLPEDNVGHYAAKELMLACYAGQVEVVTFLLCHGCDVNVKDRDGNTGLMVASFRGHKDLVKYLLCQGALVDSQNKQGMTAFSLSCFSEDVDVTIALHKTGIVDVNMSDGQGNTPLIIAAASGTTELVKRLFITCSLNTQNSDGNTALMAASRNGHQSIVEVLLHHGADTSLENHNGLTALSLANLYRQTDAIETFAAKGFTMPNSALKTETQLFLAASGNHIEIVADILNNGIDANITNRDGVTPLMMASYHGNRTIAEHLINRGASVQQQNKKQGTAMSYAVAGNHDTVVDLLLGYGVSLEEEGPQGNTILHRSVLSGSIDIVTRVVKLGVMLNHQNDQGNTAVTLAAKHGFINIVSYLISLGAALDVTNGDHMKALDYPLDKNDDVIQSALKVSGSSDDEYLRKGNQLIDECQKGNVRAVKAILREDEGLVNFSNPSRSEWTPVYTTCREGNMTLLKILYNSGACINANSSRCITPLHTAVVNNYVNMVIWLVMHGCHVNSVGDDGTSALQFAVNSGDKEVIQCLVEAGALLNKRDYRGFSPLTFSVIKKRPDLFMELVKAGAMTNIEDINGDTILIHAVNSGEEQIVIELVQRGADVNAMSHYFNTPLIDAAKEGHLNIVKFLVENGSNVNAMNHNGLNAKDVALLNGNGSIAAWLEGLNPTSIDRSIRDDTRINRYLERTRNRSTDVTETNNAISNPAEAQLSLFRSCALDVVPDPEGCIAEALENGVNLNDVNEQGETPLLISIQSGNQGITKCLVGLGGDPDTRDRKGCTALMYACHMNNIAAVKLLLENQANIHLSDNDGKIAMDFVNERGCVEIQQLLKASDIFSAIAQEKVDLLKNLTENCANVNRKGKGGRTPVHACVSNGVQNQQEMLEILISRGANVNVQDDQGMTPLHIGVLSNNLSVCDTLLVHNADINSCSAEMYADVGNLDSLVPVQILQKHMNKPSQDHTAILLQCAIAIRNKSMLPLVLTPRGTCNIGINGYRLALKIATEEGVMDILQKLLTVKPEDNSLSLTTQEALYLALDISNYEVADLLVNHALRGQKKSCLKTLDLVCILTDPGSAEIQDLESPGARQVMTPSVQDPRNELQVMWDDLLDKLHDTVIQMIIRKDIHCFQGISRSWSEPSLYFHTSRDHIKQLGHCMAEISSELGPFTDFYRLNFITQTHLSHLLSGSSLEFRPHLSGQSLKPGCAVAILEKKHLDQPTVNERCLHSLEGTTLYSIGCFIRNESGGLWFLTVVDWSRTTLETGNYCVVVETEQESHPHRLCVLSQECIVLMEVGSGTPVSVLAGRVCDNVVNRIVPNTDMAEVFSGKDVDLLNRVVTKSGYASGITEGVIIDASVAVRTDMNHTAYGSFVVAPREAGGCFSEPGDMGAVVMDSAIGKALGLVFASQKKYFSHGGQQYNNVVFCMKIDRTFKCWREKNKTLD